MAAFFSKWLFDPAKTPLSTAKDSPTWRPITASSARGIRVGDAGVVCPYVLYRTYGDTRVIEAHYAQMKKHVLTLWAGCTNGSGDQARMATGSIWGGFKGEVCGTAYQAHLASLMAEMAAAVGKDGDAATFAAMEGESRAAFQKAFFKDDGSLLESSQTGYALAFTMGLVPEALRDKAAAQFKGEVERFGGCVATGFIGTPRLPGRAACGRAGRCRIPHAVAPRVSVVALSGLVGRDNNLGALGRLASRQGFPGCEHELLFNHHAFGSCGQYLFGCVGGISALEPGFRQFQVAPVIGEGLEWASASFTSMYGEIVSEWRKADGKRALSSRPRKHAP